MKPGTIGYSIGRIWLEQQSVIIGQIAVVVYTLFYNIRLLNSLL